MISKNLNIRILLYLLLNLMEVQSNFVQFNNRLIEKVYNQCSQFLNQPLLTSSSMFINNQHYKNSQFLCSFATNKNDNVQSLTYQKRQFQQSIKDYDKLIQFIGFKSKQYFLILDGFNNKKFVLDATKVTSITSLQIFYFKVQNHEWEAYYASEKPKNDRYMPCRSITGTQIKNFLQEPGMKIIYLYGHAKKCAVCGQMLRYYADTAQNFYKKDIMSFAYINVDLNDHPLIKTKKTPSFLVFKSGSQLPESFSGQQYEKMQLKIQQVVQKQTGEVQGLTRHQYTKFLSDLEDI